MNSFSSDRRSSKLMADCGLQGWLTYEIDEIVEVGVHQWHQELGLQGNCESMCLGIFGEKLDHVFAVEFACFAVADHVE